MKYPRADLGHRPVGEENPGNGWAWKCSIRGAAEGRSRGRTVGVKDNVCLAGMPLLNGSPIMEGFVPREDATVVTRLLDAGAHIVGKTAVPAFCFDGGGLTGYPDPQPVNPHRADSSRGIFLERQRGRGRAPARPTWRWAAIRAARSGSPRRGAAAAATSRPGLVPYTGIFPIELTLDHVGPMARTVADCALMLDAIAGEDGLDPRQIGVSVRTTRPRSSVGAEGLRVGVLTEGFGIPDASEADVDAAVRAAADVLAGAGATWRRSDPDAPRRAGDLERDRDRGRDRADGPRRRLRHQPQGPLLDRPRRLLRPRAARARDDYSVTVKLTALLGAYLSDDYNHHYYAKAQNLGRRLNARTRPRSSASTCCCCRRRR